MTRAIKYARGTLWYAKLGEELVDNIGDRPVLIISDNVLNVNNSKVTALTITSNTEKGSRCENVPFINEYGEENIVVTTSIFSLRKSCLTSYKSTMTEETMFLVEQALCLSLGILSCIPMEEPCEDTTPVIEPHLTVTKEELYEAFKNHYNSLTTKSDKNKFILDNIDNYTRDELYELTGVKKSAITSMKYYAGKGRKIK